MESGAALLEASLLGIDAIGIVINPISVLISKMKTQSLYHSPFLLRKDSIPIHYILQFRQRYLDIFQDLTRLRLKFPRNRHHWGIGFSSETALSKC